MFTKLFAKPEPAVKAGAQGYEAAQLTLRVKHRRFIEALQAHGVPAAQLPVTRDLCGELLLSYAFDLPDQFVMATPALLAQSGLADATPEVLDQWVRNNFKGRFSAQLIEAGPGLMAVRTGQALEAVMLIFDGFWSDHVASHVHGAPLVSAPRRDLLLIADEGVPAAVQALRERSSEAFDGGADPHALSPQLMRWAGSGWQLLDQGEAAR